MRPYLVVLLAAAFVAARRGGDSNSGGGSSGGSGDSGTSGGGTTGSGYTPLPPEQFLPNGLSWESQCGHGPCGCSQLNQREMTFGLPGIYYNGTVTVKHEITKNTAWDGKGKDSCGMGDDDIKTYTYPALFLAAPRGNASDTNPFHWRLFGYQPADQTNGTDGPFLDLFQRWINVQSSDFVISNSSYGGGWQYSYSKGKYSLSDSTNRQQDTKVYWTTEITDWDDDEFSATAEYQTNSSQASFTSYEDVRTSNYFTLSNVCAYGQRHYADRPSPKSVIPKGNDYTNTTTPTLWFQTGATAEMKSVGADSMTFSLKNTMKIQDVYMSDRQAQCKNKDGGDSGSSPIYPYERSLFTYMREENEYNKRWAMAVKISLEFEGDVISENSTSITGRENGDVVFKQSYETPKPSSSSTSSSGDGDSGAGVVDIKMVVITALCFGLFSITFLVSV